MRAAPARAKSPPDLSPPLRHVTLARNHCGLSGAAAVPIYFFLRLTVAQPELSPTETAFRRRVASRVKNPGTEACAFSLPAEAFNGEEPEVILSKLISREGRLAARFLNAFDERLLSRRWLRHRWRPGPKRKWKIDLPQFSREANSSSLRDGAPSHKKYISIKKKKRKK